MEEKTIRRNDLPLGWEQIHLKDVCEIILGQSPPSETYNTIREGLPFFQGKAEFTELYPIIEKWCSKPKKIAEQNDILLSVRAPVGNTNIADKKCCIGRGLAALRFKNHKFLFYYLRSIEKELDKKGTGTTFKAISGDIVRNVDFLLPPLHEQNRIVAKIEELFSERDKGVEALKTAQQQLKVYRQAVLKWAFDGSFTGGLEDWEHTTLGNILKISSGNGLTKFTRNDDGQYLVYGGNGVTGNHSEFMFAEPQLIIGRVGVHCGNTHITKPQSWITDNAFVVYFNSHEINLNFLFYLIKNLNLNQLANSTAQPVISGSKVYPIKCKIPSIDIQQKVNQSIETRLSVADKVEETITQSLQQAEALRQSILKQAFAGKLVPQDPNDEPAAKLLERIKAERASQGPVKRAQ